MNQPLFLAGQAAPAAVTAGGQRLGATRASGSAALLCDRDGTIIENRDDYVRDAAHVKLLPGAVQALRRVCAAGVPVILVTNQSPIGRGLLTREHVLEVHRGLLDSLAAAGVGIAGTFICPHAPDHRCGCRKPAPGMVHAAVARFGLEASRTALVGDAVEDMLAARSAGIRGVMVRTGRGEQHAGRLATHPQAADTPVVADLAAAVELLGGLLARETTCTDKPERMARPPAVGNP
ncbi:D-glycero-alpha-D-manno-heptose-1,7-bisphosphate 7-phosphatase [Streptomyces barkulensis]|uniref:D-glycero-alpha-D-manno-heptose-1,7-bisphosphate 7-phosphatase n=1 Tax=Streptomyces barkulensis TaxID=1257026 RepID=UPI000C6F00D7|nr:HAD family hydrolase [Streptomyces barkulensis]